MPHAHRTRPLIALLIGIALVVTPVSGQMVATVTLVSPAGNVLYPLSGGLAQFVLQVEPDAAAVEAGETPAAPELRVNGLPITASDDLSLGLTVATSHDEAVRRIDPAAAMVRLNREATFFTYQVDPCTLPGGSDLPGSMLTAAFGETSRTLTLGRDTKAPTIALDAAPQRVQPGQTVQIPVTAREERGADSWQTGIQRFRLIRPTGSTEEMAVGGSGPRPCGQKQWEAQTTFTFTAAEDARPGADLTFFVEAFDWQGNRAVQSFTITIAEQEWSGTWRVVGTQQNLNGIFTDILDAQFTFRVGVDGRIIGSGTAAMTLGTGGLSLMPGPAGCIITRTLASNSVAFDVGGRKQGTMLTLTFQLPANVPPPVTTASCPGGAGVMFPPSPFPAFFGIGPCQGGSPAIAVIPIASGDVPAYSAAPMCGGYRFDTRITVHLGPL
jgi:hypothetical protein